MNLQDDHPSVTSFPEKIRNLMYRMNQQGVIPFYYHVDPFVDHNVGEDRRQQHYKATLITTTLFAFVGIVIGLDIYGFQTAHDRERHEDHMVSIDLDDKTNAPAEKLHNENSRLLHQHQHRTCSQKLLDFLYPHTSTKKFTVLFAVFSGYWRL